MTSEFQGNIKKIQWNNRLKSIGLCVYFLFGIILFTTMLLSVVFAVIYAFGGYEEIMDSLGGSVSDTARILKVYVKIFIAVGAAFVYFLYTDLKDVGYFFAADRLTLKADDLFYKTLEDLCIARGLKVPDLYLTQENGMIPDAFVTGVVVKDFAGKTSLIITPAAYHLEKAHLEAYLAQVVQRIHSGDVMFLTLFSFLGYFPFHLQQSGNPIFNFVAKPFLIVTDFLLKPVRSMVLNMSFSRLDAGALELTKDKAPMQELLSMLTPVEDIAPYVEDAYLSLFLANTNDAYRQEMLKRA